MSWSLPSDGGGLPVGSTVLHGLEDFEDTATASSPISLTAASTWYELTNDALGSNTQTALRYPGKKVIWNATTGQFEFDDLSVGDGVLLRTDVNVVITGTNRSVELGLRLAANSGTPFVLSMGRQEFKAAGTYQMVLPYWFYVGSALTRDNGAEIVARCDIAGAVNVVVNGWAVRTEPRII